MAEGCDGMMTGRGCLVVPPDLEEERGMAKTRVFNGCSSGEVLDNENNVPNRIDKGEGFQLGRNCRWRGFSSAGNPGLQILCAWTVDQ